MPRERRNPRHFSGRAPSPGAASYDLHLDLNAGLFTKDTVVDSGTTGIVITDLQVRHPLGISMRVGIAATQPEGVYPLKLTMPQADGTVKWLEVSLKVRAAAENGPALLFTDLPAGQKLVSESGVAHFELELEGAGPFVVEYGLRGKSYWVSRKWNQIQRSHALEEAQVLEGPEAESFEVLLPQDQNIIDLVAIDANGRETYQSFLVESRSPCDMDQIVEVGMGEERSSLGGKVACASCGYTNPLFSFYYFSQTGTGAPYLDTKGQNPLSLTLNACQGTICNTCCACGDESLASVSPGSGAGGYERPDGYSPPTGMFREKGFVYPHSGEYVYTVTDLSLPVPGLEFAITRTFRSQISYYGLFGREWDTNIAMRYLRYGTVTGSTAYASGDLYFYGGNGRRDKYTYSGGAFASPDGFYDKFAIDTYAGSQQIKRKDGRRFVFTETQIGNNVVIGRLSKIYDRNSNNYLTFTYDMSGQLHSITLIRRSGFFDHPHPWSHHTDLPEPGHEPRGQLHLRLRGAPTTSSRRSSTLRRPSTSTPPRPRFPSTRKARRSSTPTTRHQPAELMYNMTEIYDGRSNYGGTEKRYRAAGLSYYGTGANKEKVYQFTTDPDTTGSTWAGSLLTFTDYTTDGSGNRVCRYELSGYDSQADPENQVLRKFELTFDPSTGGLLTKVLLTPGGSTVGTWTYDRSGCTCNRPSSITDPLGRVESREYDSYGNITARILRGDPGTDDDDIVSWYKYEDPYYVNSSKYGRILESAEPEVVKDYYPGGSIASVPSASKTRYTYTGANLTKVQWPDFADETEFGGSSHQSEVSSTYNTNSQVLTKTIKLDGSTLHKTQYTYYTSGNSKSLPYQVIEDPDAGGLQLKTTYTYNARRDLVTIKDPNHDGTQVVTTLVQTGDRLISQVQPPNATSDEYVNLRYDANNNLIQRDVGGNNANERIATFFVYDRVNRQARVTQELTGDTSPLEVETGAVATRYEHDAEGRTRKVTEPGGKVRRIEYGFYSDGSVYHLRSQEFASGDGVSEYQVGEALRKKDLELVETRELIDASSSKVTDIGYDLFGRREFTVTYPSGSASYGALLTYDRNGNVTAVEKGDYAGTLSAKEDFTFKNGVFKKYDALDRVVRETTYQEYERPGDGGVTTKTHPIEFLTKQGFDGRIEVRRKPMTDGDQDVAYTYDGISRLKSITYPDGYSQLINDEIDKNGNVTKQVSREYDGEATKDYVTRFTFDDRDRLSEEVIEGY